MTEKPTVGTVDIPANEMSTDGLEAVVPDGETLRHEEESRRGRDVGLTDERLVVVGRKQVVDVPLAAIESVEIRSFNWTVALLGVGLVGLGAALVRTQGFGATVLAVGLAMLVYAYWRRNKFVAHTGPNEAPITIYLADPEAFRERIAELEERFGADDPAKEADASAGADEGDSGGTGDDESG